MIDTYTNIHKTHTHTQSSRQADRHVTDNTRTHANTYADIHNYFLPPHIKRIHTHTHTHTHTYTRIQSRPPNTHTHTHHHNNKLQPRDPHQDSSLPPLQKPDSITRATPSTVKPRDNAAQYSSTSLGRALIIVFNTCPITNRLLPVTHNATEVMLAQKTNSYYART